MILTLNRLKYLTSYELILRVGGDDAEDVIGGWNVRRNNSVC